MVVFEWDERKANANQLKHGVSFEEAKSVFNDPLSITIVDEAHSEVEERWLELGVSCFGRLLVVWYTEKSEVIRIIGSRKAMQVEQEAYERS